MALRFTLRQLEYFVAVGDAGSIAAAAKRINISSPSLSAAIAQLESEFGIDLFVRQHAQGLSLTPGGRKFFAAARSMLESAESLHDVASDISEQIRGPVTIGCLVTVAPFVLPELRQEFEAANPEVEIRQIEANHADLIRMLRRADIDIGITYDLEVPEDLGFEPLLALPPHALLHPKHPFATKKSISLRALAKEPLVLLNLPLSREYFLSLFQAAGLQPIISEQTSHLPMVRSLVANGFGYSLLNVPSKNVDAPDGKPLRYVAVSGDHRPMRLGLITTKSERKTQVLQAFEEHCRRRITHTYAPGMALL